jgi:hypothetical protein
MDARILAGLSLLLLAALPMAARAQSCVSDRECQDGSWCNGVERCEGPYKNGMCVPAREPMCSAKKACDEVKQQCLSLREVDKRLTPCPEGEKYSDKERKCVAEPRR